jgi:hypothetical protein
MMLLHSNAISENGTLREGAAWVDSDDADTFMFRTQPCGYATDERAFARTGRSCDTNGKRSARFTVDFL